MSSPHCFSQISHHCLGSSEHRACMCEYQGQGVRGREGGGEGGREGGRNDNTKTHHRSNWELDTPGPNNQPWNFRWYFRTLHSRERQEKNLCFGSQPHWSEIVLRGTNCPALVGHTCIGTEQFHVYSLDRDVLGRRRGRDCQDAPECSQLKPMRVSLRGSEVMCKAVWCA